MPKLPITDVVSIYQFQRDGQTETYQATPTYINVNACISPTGTDIQPSLDTPAFQAFEIFLYDVTLQIHNSDKIITATGIPYIVNGMPFVINNQYMQYIRVLAKQVV
jgi:hypothetical protein